MDDLVEQLKQLPMPSRCDEVNIDGIDDTTLDKMLALLMERAESGDTNLLANFRKLREIATIRQKADPLFIKIYEQSLFYSLDLNDLSGFCVCANRLIEVYFDTCNGSCARSTGNAEYITSLLLLYYALGVARGADFASVFYKIPDQVRRSEWVQYSLDVYMALKQCDYVGWGNLMERATDHQLSILKVHS